MPKSAPVCFSIGVSKSSRLMRRAPATLVPVARIAKAILILRGQKVLLDSDIAALYGVTTKALLQAVRRNRERFPEDFLIQLATEEWAVLRSQSVTLKANRGQHRKYLPYAFTEQGVAMLSSVLRSKRAIAVNIQIMRTFVRMRALISSNRELAHRLDKLETRIKKKLAVHDDAIATILSTIRGLINSPTSKRRGIGFTADIDGA